MGPDQEISSTRLDRPGASPRWERQVGEGPSPARPTASSQVSPPAPRRIMVILAGVALFLILKASPRSRRTGRRTRAFTSVLSHTTNSGTMSPRSLGHDLVWLIALILGAPSRSASPSSSRTTRRAGLPAYSAISSTCSRPCPPSSSACGASSSFGPSCSRSTDLLNDHLGWIPLSAARRRARDPRCSPAVHALLMILPIITVPVPRDLPADAATERGGGARPRRDPVGDDPSGGLPLCALRRGLRDCSASVARSVRRWRLRSSFRLRCSSR